LISYLKTGNPEVFSSGGSEGKDGSFDMPPLPSLNLDKERE
jgi:hypothetical protein